MEFLIIMVSTIFIACLLVGYGFVQSLICAIAGIAIMVVPVVLTFLAFIIIER